MFLPRLDLHCAGPLALWGFLLQFPVNISETKKHLGPPFNAGPPGTAPFGKSARVYCITFIKRLDKCLRLQFLRQNSSIPPGYTLKLVGKILSWQARVPW